MIKRKRHLFGCFRLSTARYHAKRDKKAIFRDERGWYWIRSLSWYKKLKNKRRKDGFTLVADYSERKPK